MMYSQIYHGLGVMSTQAVTQLELLGIWYILGQILNVPFL